MAPSNAPSRYPLSRTAETERQYPERYIFLLLFFVIFSRLVKALKKYKRERMHTELDELDMEESSEIGGPDDVSSISSRLYPYAENVHNSYSFNTDNLLLHVHEHSNDDRNQVRTSMIVPYFSPRNAPSLPTEIMQAHRIRHLLTQLQVAISLTQNEPEDRSHLRNVKILRRQLAEAMRIDVGRSELDYASRPPPENIEPPPAYSDILPMAAEITEYVSPMEPPS